MASKLIDKTGLERKFKALNKFMRSPTGKGVLKNIAKLASATIYRRVKQGYGVNDDTTPSPSRQRLAALTSKPYLKLRKNSNLGPFGGPRKSNLTFTGQMLEAISWKIKNRGFRIFIKDTIRTKRGNEKRTPTNADVASYVRNPKHGPSRPFLALTEKEQLIVRREYEREVRKAFQRNKMFRS